MHGRVVCVRSVYLSIMRNNPVEEQVALAVIWVETMRKAEDVLQRSTGREEARNRV